MKRLMFACLIMLSCYILRPRLASKPSCYSLPKSERTFHQEIRKQKVAVVLFYNEKQCSRRNLRHNTLNQLKQTFTRLAHSGFYPRKAVRFMQANIARPATRTIAQDYGILTDVPAIILYSDGIPIEDQHGLVKLIGTPSRQQIKQFIDQYVTIDIAQYVQEERAFKRYESVLRDRAHIYYSPYFSKVANPWNGWWGWPYYGMAQGHYGGNVGINFFGANY